MTAKPIHPDLVKHLPMNHTADIRTDHGWWFRYTVTRLHGIGIPECSVTSHRSLKSAQRAKRRWEARDAKQSMVVA